MTDVQGVDTAASAVRMGQALLDAGNPRGAQTHFHTALAGNPANPAALRGLIRAKLALNEAAEARETVDQLARVAPNDVATHELRARAHIKQGAHPLAADAAEAMIKAAPNNPMGFHLLAAARLGQKRNREAIEAVQAARKLAPHWAILLAQSGLARLELSGPYAARRDIEQAYRLAPRDPYVAYIAAVLAMALGHTRRTRELCASILRRDVNHRNALDLYVLTDGPFPMHRWAYRWTYFCRIAGPLAWIPRGLGLLLYFAIFIVLGVATAGGGWVFIFALRLWTAGEKRERAKRVRDHFAAPTVTG